MNMVTESGGVRDQPDQLLTRVRLALVLKVSLRTVDLMLADGEITPVRLRGKLVRFYLPDVLQELREDVETECGEESVSKPRRAENMDLLRSR